MPPRPTPDLFYKGRNIKHLTAEELIVVIRKMLALNPTAAREYRELMELVDMGQAQKDYKEENDE